MCWARMGRNRCFRMTLFAPGRDLFGITAPDYNRVKGCFREQYNFSLLIDSQTATVPPLTCHKSAKILASCPIIKDKLNTQQHHLAGKQTPKYFPLCRQTPTFALPVPICVCRRGEPFIAVTQTFFPLCRICPCPDQGQDLNQTKMLRVGLGGWHQLDEGWILSTKLGWPMNAPHHSKSRE